MVTLERIKELVFTAIGIMAALATATAIIFYFRLDAAQSRIEKQDQIVASVLATNKTNANTISELRDSVMETNRITSAILAARADADKRDGRLEVYMQELLKNDQKLAELLNLPLPSTIRGLFNKAGGSDGVREPQAAGAGNTANANNPKTDGRANGR